MRVKNGDVKHAGMKLKKEQKNDDETTIKNINHRTES